MFHTFESQEKEISIYWSHLTPYAQERLLEAFDIEAPEGMNWDNDIMPVATIQVPNSDDEEEIFRDIMENSKLKKGENQVNNQTYSKPFVVVVGERLISGRIFVHICPYCDQSHYHQADANDNEIVRQSDCKPGGEYLVKIQR